MFKLSKVNNKDARTKSVASIVNIEHIPYIYILYFTVIIGELH